jgi:hypothetical protein
MLIKKIKGYLVIAALYLFTFTTAYSQTTQCILNVKNDRAYFHDRTALNGKVSFTQRKAFLVLGDQVAINCQDINENWIYVSYKKSQISLPHDSQRTWVVECQTVRHQGHLSQGHQLASLAHNIRTKPRASRGHMCSVDAADHHRRSSRVTPYYAQADALP